MTDREKIINAIEKAKKQSEEYAQDRIIVPFKETDMILALLKEQEVVAVHDPGAYCPKCGWMLYPEDHPHHCGNCGQAVKWE